MLSISDDMAATLRSLIYKCQLFDIEYLTVLHLAISSIFGGKMNKLKNFMSKSGKPFQGNSPLRKALLFVVLILILGVAGLLVASYQENQNQKAEEKLARDGCNQQIIEAASPYMNLGYEKQLEPHLEKIKALPEFESDPNCLYIVAMHEAMGGHTEEAKEYLAKLEAVYDEKRGFSPHFNDSSVSVQKIRDEIERAESNKEFNKQNHGIFNSSRQERQE